jgi:probable AcnD-accessory protein PrpF
MIKRASTNNRGLQRGIAACYMRGGTSKGVFFLTGDLPADPAQRDRLLLRIIGSPDAYGKQMDGMGAGTSSTSKVVLVARSSRPDCDVDYLFGQVAIGEPMIDWSGNCGNLTAAVGPFAIARGLLPLSTQEMEPGMQIVRIWQANIGKRIVCHVPVQDGQVIEDGDFELDGVTFPATEIPIEFIDPAGGSDLALLPTGREVDVLQVPGVGAVPATLITAGNPTVVIQAARLGLHGDEMPADFNRNVPLLAHCEAIRACGAVAMGLAASVQEATERRPGTPKLALVSGPVSYRNSAGKAVEDRQIDLMVRILSMGPMHHALTGTGAIAMAVAAALPGTLVRQTIDAARNASQPFVPEQLRIGHPSGVLTVGAQARFDGQQWQVAKVVVSRSARRLMDGQVFVPASYWLPA